MFASRASTCPRPPLPNYDRAATIRPTATVETENVGRVLADVDANRGNGQM
jgi:hypothetical protein